MTVSQETLEWMLDSDPALKWQVERDLLNAPEAQWMATKALVTTEGIGARMLSLQDEDGQWAGGAHFPTREDPRALPYVEGEKGQPYISTGWSLSSVREWGVDAKALGDTSERLEKNCRWEYDDLPFWGGEVDCCINAYTLSNGLWLGRDMSHLAKWFVDHQLEDGGWNCEWIEGDTRSSFHSTLNSLFGLLDYELYTGKKAEISDARRKAEQYLLERRLMFRLSTGEPTRKASMALRAIPKSSGAIEYTRTSPSLSSAIWLGAAIESSSRPSSAWTTSTCLLPSSPSTRASDSSQRRSNTPST